MAHSGVPIPLTQCMISLCLPYPLPAVLHDSTIPTLSQAIHATVVVDADLFFLTIFLDCLNFLLLYKAAITLHSILIVQILKCSTSILPISNRKRFQMVLAFHNQLPSL